jgi:hypothetical protein
MAGVHLLDRIISGEYPSFATEADVRACEVVLTQTASVQRAPATPSGQVQPTIPMPSQSSTSPLRIQQTNRS